MPTCHEHLFKSVYMVIYRFHLFLTFVSFHLTQTNLFKEEFWTHFPQLKLDYSALTQRGFGEETQLHLQAKSGTTAGSSGEERPPIKDGRIEAAGKTNIESLLVAEFDLYCADPLFIIPPRPPSSAPV